MKWYVRVGDIYKLHGTFCKMKPSRVVMDRLELCRVGEGKFKLPDGIEEKIRSSLQRADETDSDDDMA